MKMIINVINCMADIYGIVILDIKFFHPCCKIYMCLFQKVYDLFSCFTFVGGKNINITYSISFVMRHTCIETYSCNNANGYYKMIHAVSERVLRESTFSFEEIFTYFFEILFNLFNIAILDIFISGKFSFDIRSDKSFFTLYI